LQVLFASLVGTTVEFFDFYIYATAAVIVFPKLFFPATDATAATLASLAIFAIAFIARPIGSALFGHFGDRPVRKSTLVFALSTMGLSTFAVIALPTYKTAGILASLLLACCRFGQGIGLGGEWGGAVLLATENAPPGKRAWYGMFPQLGAPIGLFFSSASFSWAFQMAQPSAVPQFRLAPAISDQRHTRPAGPLCSPDDHRHTGLRRRNGTPRGREGSYLLGH
jgi:MFS family permease